LRKLGAGFQPAIGGGTFRMCDDSGAHLGDRPFGVDFGEATGFAVEGEERVDGLMKDGDSAADGGGLVVGTSEELATAAIAEVAVFGGVRAFVEGFSARAAGQSARKASDDLVVGDRQVERLRDIATGRSGNPVERLRLRERARVAIEDKTRAGGPSAEQEKQTRMDTTDGADRPIGSRGASAADTVGHDKH